MQQPPVSQQGIYSQGDLQVERNLANDIIGYALAVWRRKGVAVGVAAIIYIIALVQIIQIEPLYSARAVVNASAQRSNVVNVQEVTETPFMNSSRIESEIQILMSRKLASRVVDDLNLLGSSSAPRRDAPKPAEPSFFRYVNPAYWIGLLDQLVFPKNTVKKVLSEKEAEQEARERAIDQILGSISVEQIGWSYVLAVEATTGSPEKSQSVANALVDAYLVSQLESKFSATERATEWLVERLAVLRESVEQAEQDVEDYRSSKGLIESAQETTVADQQISQVNGQLITVRSERASAQARLRQVEALVDSEGIEGASDNLDSGRILDLKRKQAGLNQQAAELSQEYGERHPRMVNLRAEIANVRIQIISEVESIVQRHRNDLEVNRTREAVLNKELESLKREVGSLNKDSVQLRFLERQAEAQRTLYGTFLKRFQETSVQEDLHQADAEVISYAKLPGGPSYPPKDRFLSLALLLSLLGGVATALGLDILLNRGFTSVGQLEEELRVSGVVSVAKMDGNYKTGAEKVAEEPRSLFAEALRTLDTNVKLSTIDEDGFVIMFTSSVPGEGKSTMSSSYATLMATSGRKVLLIDADLRRGTLDKIFELERMPGLVEMFLDGRSLTEVTNTNVAGGIDVITTGKRVSSPQDILGSKAFHLFLEEVREKYDLVILDTPPASIVSEARLLSKFVDKVVMVVKWQSTNRTIVRRSLQLLELAGAHVVGVVLSQVDRKKQQGYGYNYGYSHYEYGYDTPYNSD